MVISGPVGGHQCFGGTYRLCLQDINLFLYETISKNKPEKIQMVFCVAAPFADLKKPPTVGKSLSGFLVDASLEAFRVAQHIRR
jgi:hypothetical protein